MFFDPRPLITLEFRPRTKQTPAEQTHIQWATIVFAIGGSEVAFVVAVVDVIGRVHNTLSIEFMITPRDYTLSGHM